MQPRPVLSAVRPRSVRTLAAIVSVSLAVAVGAVATMRALLSAHYRSELQADAGAVAARIDHYALRSEITGVVTAIGLGDGRVQAVLRQEYSADDPETVALLTRIQKRYGASIVYVMDSEGTVVASTRFDGGQNLTGKNYDFRPYFHGAMAGRNVVYPALGVTTNKRGLYYSAPVFSPTPDSDGERPIIGVVVMKMGLAGVDALLLELDAPAAVVSPTGVVFSSNQQGWLFHTATPPGGMSGGSATDDRQFSQHSGSTTPLPVALSSARATIDGQTFAVAKTVLRLEDEHGVWGLIMLRDTGPWAPFWVLGSGGLTAFLLVSLCLLLVDNRFRRRAIEAESQRVLETSAATYKTIFHSTNDALFVLEIGTGWIMDVNDAVSDLFGYTPEEAEQFDVARLFPGEAPDAGEDIDQWLFRAERRGQQVLEWQARRKNGSLFWADIGLRRAEIDGHARILAVVRDISARKDAEARLRAAKDAAEAATRAKSGFLAVMSDEIRTPMNGVLGMTSRLAETTLTDEQRECVGTIERSGTALLRIIDDILYFSEIEAGRLELVAESFHLRNLMDGLMDRFGEQAHAKGVEVTYQVDEDVPDEVVGDAGRLRQVLVNLIGNALKFTADGLVEVGVRGLALTDTEVALQVEVHDSGIGISPEAQGRLFQAFEQGDSGPSREYGGTGLGLAISKHLVESMGGEIGVTSEPGKGSTFRFTLRLSRPDGGEVVGVETPEEGTDESECDVGEATGHA